MVASIEKHPEWDPAGHPHRLPELERVAAESAGPTSCDVDFVHLAHPNVVERSFDRLAVGRRVVHVERPNARVQRFAFRQCVQAIAKGGGRAFVIADDPGLSTFVIDRQQCRIAPEQQDRIGVALEPRPAPNRRRPKRIVCDVANPAGISLGHGPSEFTASARRLTPPSLANGDSTPNSTRISSDGQAARYE